MKYLKTFKKLLEGVGDKYAEKRFSIPNEEDEYEMKYQQSRNQDPIITTKVRNKLVSIYKNPINLNGFANGCRGVIIESGDLFIASEFEGVIHVDILNILKKKGLIKYKSTGWEDVELASNADFVTVQRVWNKKAFAIGESYVIPKRKKIEQREKVISFFKPFFNKAKRKNPKYEFLLEEYIVAIKNLLSTKELLDYRNAEGNRLNNQ